jgi:diguanylate cyclase (GGDEF)-like protein/PAS domain S-box-containing protein
MNQRISYSFGLLAVALLFLGCGLALLGWLVLLGREAGWHEDHLRLALLSLSIMSLVGAMLLVSAFQFRRLEKNLNNIDQMIALFDGIGDAIVIHDTRGKMLEVNQGACKQLGYSRDELMQLPLASIDTPECAARIPERVQELQANGRAMFEAAHVRKNGQVFPVEVHARVIEYDGQPAVLSVVRDITKRKQAEIARQESEETARALLNAIQETAMLMDREGVVLAINDIGALRVHRTPEEVLGRNFYELIPVEVANSRKPQIEKIFQTGQPLLLRDEREGQFFESKLYPVFNAAGGVTAVAVYAADVSERKQLQAVDSLFHEIDQQVLRGLPLENLLGFICSEVVRLFGYPFVWVGRKEVGGEVSIAASAGVESGYLDDLKKIGVRWDDSPQGHGPAGLTIRLGRTQVFNHADPVFLPWRTAAERFNLKSMMGIPLVIRGDVYGSFNLYSRQEHGFDDPVMVQRLSNIAGHICVALEMVLDQQQLRLLGAALSSAGNGVFITDRRGRIQWLNQSFTRITGFSSQEVLGESPRILKSGRHDAGYYQKLWQTIAAGEVWSSETIEKHKDGSEFTVQQTITPIRDTSGAVTHFVSILEDITAQKATEARIQHLAHFDTLTDLPNRTLFYDRLQQLLVQAKRNIHPLALMFLDLDRFKAVNDTLGHHVGDLLLQAVANRLRGCVRETDTVARLAGDEFTILLPQIAGPDDAATVAQKIIAVFAEPFVLDGHELRSSPSIGIALYPADAGEEAQLLKCADSAMYLAKQKGRNNYCFFEASSSDSL